MTLRYLSIAALLPLLGACYSYMPIEVSAVRPGASVRARVSQPAALQLAGAMNGRASFPSDASDMREALAVKVPQGGIGAVAFRDDGTEDWPANANIRIVPDQPTLIGVIVEATRLVMQIGEIAENAKPVREAGRHIDLSRPFVAQLNTKPLAEAR